MARSCPRCSHNNPPRARFCAHCGVLLVSPKKGLLLVWLWMGFLATLFAIVLASECSGRQSSRRQQGYGEGTMSAAEFFRSTRPQPAIPAFEIPAPKE